VYVLEAVYKAGYARHGRHGRRLRSPWVGLGLGRIFLNFRGLVWVGLGQARTTSYNSITPSKVLDTNFYDFNTVL